MKENIENCQKYILESFPQEIDRVEKVIEEFELVSCRQLHRDPSRDKCQAYHFV